MSMNVGGGGGDEDEVVSSINTTPLVDVMLVLLIIFLITIPVVTHSIPVQLPKESNIATMTKPENILLSVSREGEVFWNTQLIEDNEALVNRLKQVSVKNHSQKCIFGAIWKRAMRQLAEWYLRVSGLALLRSVLLRSRQHAIKKLLGQQLINH